MRAPPLTGFCTAKTAPGKEAVSSRFDVLIDSDAFVGWFYPEDPHFQEAASIFAALEEKERRPVTTSMVVAETATVLSYRQGQALAREYLRKIDESKLPIIHITEALLKEAVKLFVAQSERGTSMTDCANLVVMGHFSISTIFSFDRVYPKKFGLKLAA
jgi:predicted nucleic acid-binding protein